MRLEELKQRIETVRWFSSLGTFPPREGFVPIRDLQAWADAVPGLTEEAAGEDPIADEMDWLPSSQSQEDPVHGNSLAQLAKKLGVEDRLKKARVEFFKAALDSLGKQMTPSPLFVVGPHDFSEAAKGAALFAVRMSVTEILAGKEGFWCSLISLYEEGFWPCGTLSSGQVVVL
ncbi:hypothetical protein POL68_21965 [Stigmatella sp. ncwal1]|uniref:Uncharacterized protein n=1 Tax=Stigmatella ashevillensis TaxID=2995309 RepID=A0ABT5DFM1_9BACT|nr:hypothetical protein [Stigmatella ashevillena]MDC0711151.1 hypothetical protein [Stigmatella ashevillena]